MVLAGFLVSATLGFGAFTMWTAYGAHKDLTVILEHNVTALAYAHDLETSLLLQKGYVAQFSSDGQPHWLEQLRHHTVVFEDRLKKARDTSYTLEQRNLLNDIESIGIRFSYARDEAVEAFRSGRREEGFQLRQQMDEKFYALWGLCEKYRKLHERDIDDARGEILSQIGFINAFTLFYLIVAVLFWSFLHHTLLHRILNPIALLVGDGEGKRGGKDEVEALSRRVKSLISDVDQTQSALQLSREHLLQAEKLAMVGKLAAGVAHSVRNPLTSVKMRLFSLERSLQMDAMQKEDFEVISEEIAHIDTIVRNFLEFSRRPKLALQMISPSDVVDSAIQLLAHRLEGFGVELELYRQRRLPLIEGDPEQLKEVLVNLIVNACEAMGDGGRIQIIEEEGKTGPMGHVAVIRVVDNGPGIPKADQEKVFQPFYSTREEGTGLGLSIAARIIEDHRGCLNLKSREGKGTTFTITLPCREDTSWLRS